MDDNNDEGAVALAIAPADAEPLEPVLPPLSYRAAQIAYNFLMPGMVARLYLYLFGEIDKEIVEMCVERITEKRKVLKEILDNKAPPMLTIYEFLIAEELLEDQALGEKALAHLSLNDQLQFRVVDEEDEEEQTEEVVP